jgi:TolB protein
MGVGKPAWSPDGSRIAFEHLGDEDFWPAQTFVMNADGSLPRLVSIIPNRTYAESDPAWSPDGSQIAFWSYGFGIASAPASSGLPRSIYHSFPTVAYGARPAWSPDGSTVMFTVNRYTIFGPSLWQVPSAGGPAAVFAEGAAEGVRSPDGTRVALVRVTRTPDGTAAGVWR